ncbi:MAG: hypothetical protein IH864_08105 [Chloroflexi bacterium]|nr:hypothetical protein [Chloroflexota bacterium]
MKIDMTKLPLGEALIGFVLAALVVTFVLAFAIGNNDGGIGGEEAVVEMSPTPGPEETPSDGGTTGEGTVVEIAMVPVIQFDTTDVTVPAGLMVTLTADNREPGILHNWAVYESREVAESEGPSAAIALTEICVDCTETITFEPPPPGDYFFRCDVHPVQMVGTFVVE